MNIREIILSITEDKFKSSYARLCTVDVVNDDSTADVTPIDGGTKILGVLIQADQKSGIYLRPTLGSIVAVQMYSDFNGAIVAFSQLDSIQMLDGSLGGLTKTLELKTQLDKLNDQLQAVITALGWTPVPNDGGAALKTAFNLAITGKPEADFSQIENESITQGQP